MSNFSAELAALSGQNASIAEPWEANKEEGYAKVQDQIRHYAGLTQSSIVIIGLDRNAVRQSDYLIGKLAVEGLRMDRTTFNGRIYLFAQWAGNELPFDRNHPPAPAFNISQSWEITPS